MDGHVSFYKRIEWILLTLSEFVGLQSKSANVIITAPLYVLILLVRLLSFNLGGSKLLCGKILMRFMSSSSSSRSSSFTFQSSKFGSSSISNRLAQVV